MTITIQEIKDRTDEVGECWIWKRGTTSGYPQLKVPGRACKRGHAWKDYTNPFGGLM